MAPERLKHTLKAPNLIQSVSQEVVTRNVEIEKEHLLRVDGPLAAFLGRPQHSPEQIHLIDGIDSFLWEKRSKRNTKPIRVDGREELKIQ